jgi:ParB family chromosome partitioning protein
MQATSIDARSGELMTIPLSLLVASPMRNARKTASTSVADLKASIEAQGLLQNLIVCPADSTHKGRADAKGQTVQRYEVVGGGRRLRALIELAAEHRIGKDEDILCRVKPTREAAEASLAENYHREPMHPADEFEAFQRLVQDGATVEEVAQRFGTSPLTVRRRLKLADVHPELRQLYRDEGITMEQLMALALSDDPEQQLTVWNAAPAWSRDAHNLRSMLVSDEVDATTDALAKFVGIEVYEGAGGRVRRDLFSEAGEGYLQDTALLDRLAAARLDAVADEVRGEGWAWVEIALRASTLELYKFGRAPKTKRGMTRKEAKERKALERQFGELERELDRAQDAASDDDADDSGASADEAERLEQECEDVLAQLRAMEEGLSTYDETAMSCSGVIVCVGRNGAVQIHRGLLKPGGRMAASQPDEDAGDQQDADEASKPRVKPTHSAALMRELTAHRTLAARAAILDRPDVALTALLHCLVQRLLLDSYGRAQTPVRLSCTSPEEGLAPEAGSTLSEARATGLLAEARRRWGDRIPGDPGRLLPWLAALSEGEKMELLALCVALNINDVHADERPGSIEPLCALLGLDMSDWWEAGCATYFARVTKDVIVGAITEGTGAEAAAKYKGVSKGELARVAERDLAGRRWLPAPLRSPSDGVAV